MRKRAAPKGATRQADLHLVRVSRVETAVAVPTQLFGARNHEAETAAPYQMRLAASDVTSDETGSGFGSRPQRQAGWFKLDFMMDSVET